MKKTIIAVILVSLIICASGCADSGLKNSSQSNSSPTTSSIESSDFSDNSSDEKSEGTFEESEYSYSEISENSDYELSEDDVESEISEISEESEVLPVEYSEAVDEDDEDNESSLSASKLKDDLDNFFIDNSLGAEYRALVEAYGKDYVKNILFIMTVLMISLSWKRITGQSENGRLKTIRSCLAMKKQPMALDHLKICLIQFRAAIHIRPSAKFQILCQLQKISASLMMTDL